jgi:hypothetical protein
MSRHRAGSPNGTKRLSQGMAALAGEKPVGYATAGTWDETIDPGPSQQIGRGPGGRANTRGGLNMRAVTEVLESYGLDPIEELAKVITAVEAVRVNGQPVIDPETGKVLEKPVLPVDLRTKTLLELAQYSRPKLKAVEVTLKPPELTDEQIDRRLQALMNPPKATKAKT